MSDFASSSSLSQELAGRLHSFVSTLLQRLDEQIDKRLVRTFLAGLEAIIMLRHTKYSLLLSELGGYILSPDKAPAGTKRLSNLLRSRKWSYEIIESFLQEGADQEVRELMTDGQSPLESIGYLG